MGERRRYSKEFKVDAVRQMEGANLSELARRLGIRRKFLYAWREQLRAGGEQALGRVQGRPPTERKPPSEAETALQKRIAELERKLGVKQLEVDFFRNTFEHVREVMQSPTAAGGKQSIKGSKPRFRSKEQD